MSATWTEKYIGGSPDAERREFERLAGMFRTIQLRNQQQASTPAAPQDIRRTFHAKPTAAVEDAELRFLDLPPDLRAGFARPGATYPAVVRFSNASGVCQPDSEPDLRCVALRIQVSPDEQHDLLLANFPAFFARDLRQLAALTRVQSSSGAARAPALIRLVLAYGLAGTVRMGRNLRKGKGQVVDSVATQTYWSQGAMRWGDELAVRYLLRPVPDLPPRPGASSRAPDRLSRELAHRLIGADVRFELCLQRFRDERSTPIEDPSAEWSLRDSPAEPVAVLTIGRRDLGDAQARTGARAVEAMAFNLWNTTDEFRPLGSVNRARKVAYEASAARRNGMPRHPQVPVRTKALPAAVPVVLAVLGRYVPWHRVPSRLGPIDPTDLRPVLPRRKPHGPRAAGP
jgi:hypothetical protein